MAVKLEVVEVFFSFQIFCCVLVFFVWKIPLSKQFSKHMCIKKYGLKCFSVFKQIM